MYLWKVACAVADQQARLAAATIADHDQLLRVGGRLGDVGIAGSYRGIGADGAIAISLAGSADRLADGSDGGDGRLCALLAAQVVVVLCGSLLGRHGCGFGINIRCACVCMRVRVRLQEFVRCTAGVGGGKRASE